MTQTLEQAQTELEEYKELLAIAVAKEKQRRELDQRLKDLLSGQFGETLSMVKDLRANPMKAMTMIPNMMKDGLSLSEEDRENLLGLQEVCSVFLPKSSKALKPLI